MQKCTWSYSPQFSPTNFPKFIPCPTLPTTCPIFLKITYWVKLMMPMYVLVWGYLLEHTVLPGATPFKKTDFSVAILTVWFFHRKEGTWGLVHPSVLKAGMLSGLLLCRSCSGNTAAGSMSTEVLSRHADTVVFQPSTIPGSCSLYPTCFHNGL